MIVGRMLLLALCSSAIVVQGADTECTTGRTTIVVTDCSGAAVEQARVAVKICCGNGRNETGTTDSAGEVTFKASRKDICEREISLAGFAMNKGGLGGCSGDDKNATCRVQICSR